MIQLRATAEKNFQALPFPTGKDENFRFISLQEIVSSGTLPSLEFSSTPEEKEAGVLQIVGKEAKSLKVHPCLSDLLSRQPVLGSIFPEDKFAQHTEAQWSNGVCLQVPRGEKIILPLRAALFAGRENEHFRHFLHLAEGAEATFVQEVWGRSGEKSLGELTELVLEEGAKLHWIQVQALEGSTQAIFRQKITLKKNAELKITSVHLGAGTSQLRQEIFVGENAQLDCVSAAKGKGQQAMDFWLDVTHAGSNSKSQVNYVFVMRDSAKGIFNGIVRIPPTSLHCDASQKCKSLLMGKATVHAIPKLIIQTDQVKCSHGASVASVSPEQVHYLGSRGIPPAEAEAMIIEGFTAPALDRFPSDAARERVAKFL